MLIRQEEAEKKEWISKKTNAIYDSQFIKILKNIPWPEWLTTPNIFRCRLEYLDFYLQWVLSSKLNSIRGLENFRYRDLINGTTQTFDEAYLEHIHRRLRFFKGEYAYHRRIVKNWCFLEDAPIDKDDYLIISAPFCSTGLLHPDFYSVLDQALAVQAPVIVDCAYFGTCENFQIDVSHPAIESVSFSLTKGLGLGDIRSGIRFSNLENQLPIRQQNNYDHTVLCAARIGLHMMQNIGPDFIPDKYSIVQKMVCAELGLNPTPCMHIALADKPEWDDYIIDGTYRRVGIRNLIKARFNGETP